MDERLYYLGFSNFSGIGPVRFSNLITTFGTAKKAWDADQDKLEKVLGKITAQKFISFRKSFSFEEYQKKLAQKRVEFITIIDKAYPQNLKTIKNPPYVLYCKGKISLLNTDKMIAVVGTRKITHYGESVTEMLVSDLVAAGFVIVSGLAIGVDAAAHRATIDNNGTTIAVLGCGVDCCYPSSNQSIYNSILSHGGLIISEFPLSQQPNVGSFPSRNRIIAGLSLGTLVTEGAQDSGSLITAELAIKNNRKVFAIPGPITSSLSVGPYKLLKQGAVLVSSAGEILEELDVKSTTGTIRTTSTTGFKNATKDEQKVLEILENESLSFDDIVRQLKKDSSTVGSLLTLMEIKGMIKSLNSGSFSIVN